MPEVEVINADFSDGLVTVSPPHAIGVGASPAVENVDFSETVGALQKRKGISVEFTELIVVGFTAVGGLYQYIQQDGDKFIVASAGDDVYNLTGAGTWTSIFTSAGLDGEDVNFATFKDLLIIVNESITTQKWTGVGATAALLGTPPSNAKFIEIHKGRVWIANTSAGKSRLHFSALNNAEDWTTANDAGFIDISPDDGDQITGLASVGTLLIVFKKLSTHAIYGFKPENFTVRRLSSSVGCRYHRSIVKADAFALFLSDRGIYSASINGVALVSYPVKPTIENLSDTVKGGTAAGRFKSQYWLAYDSDGDGKNDRAYILDYVNGIWTQYTNIKARVFLTKDDGVMLSGGSDKIIVREHNDTNDDEGGAITMKWDSKDYDFGSFVLDKQLLDIAIFAEALSAKNLTVQHLIDGALQADSITVSLTASGSEDKIMELTDALQSSQGKHIRLRLSNAEVTAPVKVFGYSMLAERRNRQD